MKYTICEYCDHFVTDSESFVDSDQKCQFLHLQDGEQEFDHDAKASDASMTMDEWKVKKPELFCKHPDSKIGPNSYFHSRRGKIDGLWGKCETSLTAQRHGVADDLFENTDFNDNMVHQVDNWECFPNRMTMNFLYTENDDGPFIKAVFTVVFVPDSTQVLDICWDKYV